MQSARPTHEACLPRSAVFLAIFVNKMKPGWGDKVGEKKKKDQFWSNLTQREKSAERIHSSQVRQIKIVSFFLNCNK